MERKTISINPNLFTLNKIKSNKKKKELPIKIQKPNNIKKELIKKIRNYQNKTKKRKSYQLDDKFNNEFKESIDYLRNVINESKLKDNEKHLEQDISIVNPIINISHQPINKTPINTESINTESINTESINTEPINIEPINTENIYVTTNYNSNKLLPEPPYSCLKNSSKPTYRNWMSNKTLKNKKEHLIQSTVNSLPIQNIPLQLEQSEYKIQNKPDKDKKLKKKTIKKKYTCGKSKTKKQIGIIIKSIDTRNKVLKEYRELKKKSIQEIKNYLYNKSFIKVGSTAPDKVLRDMYESLLLTGDVNNKNSHILLHNYKNEYNL